VSRRPVGARRRAVARAAALAAAAASLVAAAVALPSGAVASDVAKGGPLAFLVLPFENTGEDPALAWLSAGLAQHTGDHLRSRGAAVVEDEDRSAFLESQGIPPGASMTLASALEVARTMRARPAGLRPDRLVLGRFAVQEGQVTLSGRVINLANESAGAWITREGRLKDLLDVHANLADQLQREASLPRHGSDPLVEPPLIAFETYCRALGESDVHRRLGLLRRALGEFPGYPLAAYQAAQLLVRAEQWREASDTLATASGPAQPYAADFHLLEATVALGLKDPAAAVQAAHRSIDVVDSARAHVLLGRAQAALGDRGAARTELDRAVALDPSEPEIEDLRKALAAEAATTGRTP
jgi:tetratricopeptide (TPR) repeat protein